MADKVYCVSAEGDCVVVAASDNYELIAKNPLGETCRSTPSVSDGRLYLRTQSHLISLGGKKKTHLAILTNAEIRQFFFQEFNGNS